MHSNSIKVIAAASLLGGWLFWVGGCSMSPDEQVSVEGAVQVEVEFTPTATVVSPEVVATVSTAGLTSTPQPPTPGPSSTPTVPAMPIPTPAHGPFSYHAIAEGQTLGYIALLYQTEINELVEMNELAGPSALIQIGQVLRVPVGTDNIAPGETLLPDSEVVYGPGYVGFDIAEFVADQQGYLASYTEVVEGQTLTGAEIIKRVAEQFSVGPRVLLALLEHYGGWVTNPTVTEEQLNGPLGPRNPRGGSLYLALGFTANRINAGYYGYKRDGFWVFHLADRGRAITPQGVNAGTVGIQNILAIHSDFDTWQQEISQDGFMADYRALFDDPFAQEFVPIVPIDLTQPTLSLPWAMGQSFYYTSGPHGGFADGSAWSAVDFGPPDVLGNCFYSKEPSTAAASGIVVAARQGEVHLDLDGDGHIQTGWVLQYLHVALDVDNPVQVGQTLQAGDPIGYASCEGGLANSSHLHFARRFNGEWLEAGGPVPMNLSGWIVQPNLTPYEGTIVKAGQVRSACECWDPELNLVVNEEAE